MTELPRTQALRCFITVAREGTVSRAAAMLKLTQPAVSLQLKALEESTGLQLFNRTPSGFTLTEAGASLLPLAHRAVAAASDFKAMADSLNEAQRGTLRVGDIIVAGAEMGRVRALISDQGENLEEAGPSVPVEVLGFNGPPEAGDRLAVVENEARARQVTSYRAHQKRENAAASISGMRGSLEQMMSQLKTAGRKEFPLIVKADVQGSLEAILGSLEKLGTDEVAARILHAGVGGISESDVTLAEGFNAAIIGFSVRANKEAAAAAKRNGIEIRYYNIIYDLVDDIKKAMSGLLAPTLRETMLGNAQILEVFNISKVGKVAGCRVTDGTVERGANVRLIRDNVVVHEGKLSTLKRFKDEVKEVQSGQECGMAFENYGDMRVGDVIECYRIETIQRSL